MINDSIKEFVERLDIDSLKNIAYCHASDSLLLKLFGSFNIPAAFLYDMNNRLLAKHIGEVNLDDLVNMIR